MALNWVCAFSGRFASRVRGGVQRTFRRLLALLVILGSVCAGERGGLRAGEIRGVVSAQLPGEVLREGQSTGGPGYESRKLRFAERVDYTQLQGFVVYIDQPMTNNAVPPLKPVRLVTQKDAVFRPHVLPVVRGTVVEWPNEDTIFHNVFSMSPGNEFDLGLYKSAGPDGWPKVTFARPGRADVFCSIHSRMNCVVLVLENSHFASVDASGRYHLTNVPPGVWKLKAWHERLPAVVRQVTVPESGEVQVDFRMGPVSTPTRAPSSP